ncbi:hypothetical protein RB595_003755 [Gaeumannomyces hyphopodioides]
MANHTSAFLARYSIFTSPAEPRLDLPDSSDNALWPRRLEYYVALGCVLLAAYLFQSYRDAKRKTIAVPFYKASLFKWMFDAETLVTDSYNKFYGKVYQIKATEGVQVIIPPNILAEIKGLPEETLSSTAAVAEAMMGEYTHFHLGKNTNLMSALIRTKLTQNVARMVPRMKEDIDNLVATEFPKCDDWTAVKISPFAVRSIVRVGGRAFVGPDVARDEEWAEASVGFCVHVFTAVVKLQVMPAWLRPLGQYLVSDLAKIRHHMTRAKRLMRPVIEQRLRDLDTPGADRPDDLIQWLLEALPESERADVDSQVMLQLVLCAASIHSSSNLLVEGIYDLADKPEVQAELRREVEEVFAKGGWSKRDSIMKLKKMDSFMKEVQRLRGNITGFIRKVVKPIDLSDGTHLPAGTKLLAPQAGMSQDASFYESPETFDALRFYKMRQRSDEDRNRWQFTSIENTNMNFGAGKHSCPGRFFAGTEIKMLLAYFLLHYDMRLKDGEQRPKGFVVMMSKGANPEGEIMFRRRECAGY